MEILGTLFSSVLGGGATGLLGVLLQRWFDFKAKSQEIEVVKLNHQNALDLSKSESERARMRADADVAIADRQGDAVENEAAERSLQASYGADKATYLSADGQKRKGVMGSVIVFMMACVDFARGILRPGLTIYLTVIVTYMFNAVMVMLAAKGHDFTTTELATLLAQIVATILYCFTTVVVWWFGTRPPKKEGSA